MRRVIGTCNCYCLLFASLFGTCRHLLEATASKHSVLPFFYDTLSRLSLYVRIGSAVAAVEGAQNDNAVTDVKSHHIFIFWVLTEAAYARQLQV